MPITYKTGNILDSTCDAVVITTNCVGVMGKGIALQAKNKWPLVYQMYKQDCSVYHPQGGDVYLYDIGTIVLCCMTKEHWRDPSKMEWITRGLQNIVKRILNEKLKSIAIPPLGCGNGGLKWTEVRPLIEKYLTGLDCDVHIYGPQR